MAFDEGLAQQFRDGVASFPKSTLAFLRALAATNTRDWFTAHKADYESALKAPAEAFAAALAGRLEELTGETHRARIFRIYRDVRFSHDKTPYNAHLHLSLQGRRAKGRPGFSASIPDRSTWVPVFSRSGRRRSITIAAGFWGQMGATCSI